MRQVEAGLQAALDAARPAGLDREDLVEILDTLIRAEQQESAS